MYEADDKVGDCGAENVAAPALERSVPDVGDVVDDPAPAAVILRRRAI